MLPQRNHQHLSFYFILALAVVKLSIHLLTNTRYNFHRDEFLYLAEGQHLGWGYMEVPPFIAGIAWLAHAFGGSLFVVRLFPALIGAVTVVVLALFVKEIGGKKWAQLLACLSFIIAPSFLGSNTLFQPVSFIQFWWFLTAFFLVRIINHANRADWYALGVCVGLGFLTKYSILFYVVACLIAICFTPQRKWFTNRNFYLAFAIALIIALPNIIWQVQHNFPVLAHMEDLQATQLVHIDPLGFIAGQFWPMPGTILIWLPGLWWLLRSDQGKPYRILGWSFILAFLFLLLLSGKAYYLRGSYTMLIGAGGVALEQLWTTKKQLFLTASLALQLILNGWMYPFRLPILSMDQLTKYSSFMHQSFGLEGPLIWEDGQLHELPQDIADMNGWEETAQKVARIYHALPEDQQKSCMLYGGGYVHAGLLNYYGKKYDLPPCYSFNSSFMMWAPDSIHFDRQIMVDDVRSTTSQWFDTMELVDSIENKFARDPGYIYFRESPKIDVDSAWTVIAREQKAPFNF